MTTSEKDTLVTNKSDNDIIIDILNPYLIFNTKYNIRLYKDCNKMIIPDKINIEIVDHFIIYCDEMDIHTIDFKIQIKKSNLYKINSLNDLKIKKEKERNEYLIKFIVSQKTDAEIKYFIKNDEIYLCYNTTINHINSLIQDLEELINTDRRNDKQEGCRW